MNIYRVTVEYQGDPYNVIVSASTVLDAEQWVVKKGYHTTKILDVCELVNLDEEGTCHLLTDARLIA